MDYTSNWNSETCANHFHLSPHTGDTLTNSIKALIAKLYKNASSRQLNFKTAFH